MQLNLNDCPIFAVEVFVSAADDLECMPFDLGLSTAASITLPLFAILTEYSSSIRLHLLYDDMNSALLFVSDVDNHGMIRHNRLIGYRSIAEIICISSRNTRRQQTHKPQMRLRENTKH